MTAKELKELFIKPEQRNKVVVIVIAEGSRMILKDEEGIPEGHLAYLYPIGYEGNVEIILEDMGKAIKHLIKANS